jgi:uncharacterized protein (TIGR02300 family)
MAIDRSGAKTTSIEETEDMNASDRGLKHLCSECGCKYFDLGKEVVVCPKCGVRAPVAEAAKPAPARPDRKTGHMRFGRYP